MKGYVLLTKLGFAAMGPDGLLGIFAGRYHAFDAVLAATGGEPGSWDRFVMREGRWELGS